MFLCQTGKAQILLQAFLALRKMDSAMFLSSQNTKSRCFCLHKGCFAKLMLKMAW